MDTRSIVRRWREFVRPLPRPDNRLYLGRGGSGKTTLCMEHAGAFDRVLLVRPDDSERAPYPATRDRRRLIETMMAPSFRVTFNVDMQREQWEWASEAAFRAGNVVVIWEEAGTLMSGRSLKDYAPWAFSLWMRGRHRRCRVFACSQRPASVSPDVRANLSRAVIFNTTEPNDLRWYRGMIGDPGVIDAIRSLDFAAHEAVDWTPAGHSVKRAPFD